MSNKIVPTIYRAVIDDVISSIKSEFDEYGVGEEVLAELQHKWEDKVMASHVAEFEPQPPPPPPPPVQHPPPFVPHPSLHPMHNQHYPAPYLQQPHQVQQAGAPHIKAEPVDSRYMLNGAPGLSTSAYAFPPLPGPQIPGRQNSQYSVAPGRPPSAVSAPPPPTARYPPPPPGSHLQAARIPQVDGPSSSGSESSSPPSQSYAPRSSHPSLPQPSLGSATAREDDSEAINSDLDDSDSDNEEEMDESRSADTDIVFCTYDKVARVKNKWKCILKDGMIHINGKDYLFAKCTGEFEW
ncbi:transcription factor IIA alpha/beta subunit [Amylocystis lapponica]|nr:transcription factor IIA alpha/beta subunit [Amylocystis lapponica]